MKQMTEKITKSTVLPLGLVITLLVVATTSAWSVSTKLTEIDFSILDLRSQLTRLELKLANGFSREDARHFADVLRANNPDLNIPILK